MTEKVMQTLFGKHLKIDPPSETEIYELKIVKGNALPFNSLKDHQRQALIQAHKEFFYHKITDPPVFYGMNTRFNRSRPFDCFIVVKVNAYVVIWYYKPRQKKEFIKIHIQDFYEEELKADRKSLTEERARQIGTPFFIKHESN